MEPGKRLPGKVTIITGGASGIGEATARIFAGHGAIVVLCDLQDQLGERVAAEIGAAGGTAEYRHLDVTKESEGPPWSVHAAMIRAGGGSIINISSICGIVGSFGNAAYNASKGAVRIFTKSAALQYAKDRIRVNSVHPGFVETPLAAPGLVGTPGKARMDATPLGRYGKPSDIAFGCLYLASDETAWMTGSELVIDGGMTAN
jgi:NAD(P)-dependent dehydrogenase (short-subunit alcohol dehydrogenase family)